MISSNVEYSKFRGLSTDTKPTAENGATFFEMDTSKTYMYDKENAEWCEIETGGSGGGGGNSKSSPIVGTGVVGSMVVGSESGGLLPEVTAEDDGDVLTVVSGAWAKATPSGGDGGVLFATITQDENTGDSTLDKSYNDLIGAINSGKLIYAKWVGETGVSLYPIFEVDFNDGSYYATVAILSADGHMSVPFYADGADEPLVALAPNG